MKKEVAEAYTLVGKSHDCGNKLGYMKAFVEYGLHNSALKEEFTSWMRDFCEKTLLPKTEVIEEDEVSETQKIVAIF